MARLGVTFQEVANAANQIKGQGKNPTIEQIRGILKTGSSTTIARHLSQWRAEQSDTDLLATQENLPTEFIALMKGLWQRVLREAADKITKLEQEADEAIQALTLQVEGLAKQNQAWELSSTKLAAEKGALTLSLQEAQGHITQQEQALVAGLAKQEALTQQCEEKQAYIEELRRLHQQVQENLEHYRETTREQRLLDQERHTQQIQQLEFSLKEAQQQYQMLSIEKNQLQQYQEKLQYECETVKANHQQLLQQIDKQTLAMKTMEETEREASRRAAGWEKQYQTLDQQFKTQQQAHLKQEKETALMSNQITSLQQELKSHKDQNILLTQEKWELAREKALAEGQIKQLQVILEKNPAKIKVLA